MRCTMLLGCCCDTQHGVRLLAALPWMVGPTILRTGHATCPAGMSLSRLAVCCKALSNLLCYRATALANLHCVEHSTVQTADGYDLLPYCCRYPRALTLRKGDLTVKQYKGVRKYMEGAVYGKCIPGQ